MSETYHENTDQKAHKEYVRIECLDLAIKRYPYKSSSELIKCAKEMEDYIFSHTPGKVIKLVNNRKNNET